MSLLTLLRKAAELADKKPLTPTPNNPIVRSSNEPSANKTEMQIPAKRSRTPPDKPRQIATRVLPGEPKPPKCAGCRASFINKMISVGHGAFSVAKFAAQMTVGQKATEEQQATRKTACEGCTAVDSKGDRIYREISPGVFSCGQSAKEKLFRDKTVDGCGCWLNLKWIAKDEKCPLNPPRW